jgi:hypothetical protein
MRVQAPALQPVLLDVRSENSTFDLLVFQTVTVFAIALPVPAGNFGTPSGLDAFKPETGTGRRPTWSDPVELERFLPSPWTKWLYHN